ncbi:SIS domain-containing protein [Algoriphagus sp.]|uniref:SIS domain-containing protein n=1 Tax=Algoriphagus sp. TaxID=1872435 RepID=UPI0025D759AB|nr:SIS domain-containing protein [Algoriphagus sp.]
MQSPLTQSYYLVLQKKLNLALGQEGKIQLAAKWIAESLQNQGWIYAIGTGHSHILAEEIFYRAGGFARVRPIFAPKLMLHIDATGSTEAERQEGLAKKYLGNYSLSNKDIFILASNSGRNPVPIDLALEASKAGAKTICITNISHSKSVNSRHSSEKKLFEVCELAFDNFGEIGDASITLEGFNSKMGATSTIIGSAILNTIMLEAASIIINSGHNPEIFHSSNTDLGEKHNIGIIKKYKNLVKGL